MAAKYDQQKPKWVDEESEMKRSTGAASQHFTNDDPATNYKSRSDDPTLKRPT